MKILLRFCLLFTVSSALAKAYDSKIGLDESEIHDEEVKLWQFMTDDVGGHNDGHEDGENNEDGFPLGPTKHPYKQCLEDYHGCVQNSCKIWERQKACLLQFYRCQNEYTRKCRDLYKNKGCYGEHGRDECWKKLRMCYGHPPEKK